MKHRQNHLLTLLALLAGMQASAREEQATLKFLWPRLQDELVVTYDVSYKEEGKCEITFKDVRPCKANASDDTYSTATLAVLFFDVVKGDETVDLDDDAENIVKLNPIKVPAEMKQEGKKQGRYQIADEPVLTYTLPVGEKAELEIPLYLADHPQDNFISKKWKWLTRNKTQFIIFGLTESLHIKVSPPGNSNTQQTTEEERTVEEVIEGESDVMDKDQEAKLRCQHVRIALEEERDPIEELATDISRLKEIEYEVKGPTREMIAETVKLYQDRKKELKKDEEEKIKNEEVEAQRLAKEHEAKLKAEQDSIAQAQEEEAAKKEKRNMLMLIGGAILASLMFVGKQILDYVKSRRNIGDIKKMQDNMARQAENEAKRRAISMARNAEHKAVNDMRTKARKGIQEGVNKVAEKAKNPKKGSFSI